jgi:hypothetical protein
VTNGGVKEEITDNKKVQESFYQLVSNILWKWEIPNKSKICLFKSYYMPILMYGAETWTWTKADISRLMTEDMRFLKSIKGKTKRDRIRN